MSEERKAWRHVIATKRDLEYVLNELAGEGYMIKDVLTSHYVHGPDGKTGEIDTLIDFHVIAFHPEEITKITMATQAAGLQQQLLEMIQQAQKGTPLK